MALLVTGAAGFIGSNLVKALNDRGETDIVAVDNLERADKVANIAGLEISDYLDKRELIERVRALPIRQPARVILITAHHSPDLIELSRRVKVDDYLIKPVSSGTLIAHLNKLVRRARVSQPPKTAASN